MILPGIEPMVGAPVAADLGLVPHAAEAHAHELAARRLGDRLAERGLADAGRADEAQNRARELVGPLLHGEILDDALLDLVEAVMVGVERLLRELGSFLTFDFLPQGARSSSRGSCAPPSPRRTFGDIWRSFLSSCIALSRASLESFVRLILSSSSGDLVLLLAVAELLLDRLHLLVEVVLALRLLHLALHAGADALLDLQHRDLALHQPSTFSRRVGPTRSRASPACRRS